MWNYRCKVAADRTRDQRYRRAEMVRAKVGNEASPVGRRDAERYLMHEATTNNDDQVDTGVDKTRLVALR